MGRITDCIFVVVWWSFPKALYFNMLNTSFDKLCNSTSEFVLGAICLYLPDCYKFLWGRCGEIWDILHLISKPLTSVARRYVQFCFWCCWFLESWRFSSNYYKEFSPFSYRLVILVMLLVVNTWICVSQLSCIASLGPCHFSRTPDPVSSGIC